MTKDIIKTVSGEMKQQNVTQKDLAELSGITETQASRILNGNSNQLPKFWEKTFDRLGLRLVIVPKDAKVTVSREL